MPTSFAADMYDPETNTWTRLPDLPRPIMHAGTAVDDDNVYLAGGVVGSTNPIVRAKLSAASEVWRYHVPTQTWSVLPPLFEPRGAGALAVVDDALHFFGGTTRDRYTRVGEDLGGAAAWEVAAPLPNPRNHLSSAVLGGKIYVIGGQHGHNETLVTQRSVHVWDPETSKRWTELASLPYGLGHTSNATLAYQGRIYVMAVKRSGSFSATRCWSTTRLPTCGRSPPRFLPANTRCSPASSATGFSSPGVRTSASARGVAFCPVAKSGSSRSRTLEAGRS